MGYPTCQLCNHEIVVEHVAAEGQKLYLRHPDKLDCIIHLLHDIRADIRLARDRTIESVKLFESGRVAEMTRTYEVNPDRKEHVIGCQMRPWRDCGGSSASCGCWCHQGEAL